jgi:hypothetical protein
MTKNSGFASSRVQQATCRKPALGVPLADCRNEFVLSARGSGGRAISVRWQATGRKPAMGFRWRTAEMDSHFLPGTLALVISARDAPLFGERAGAGAAQRKVAMSRRSEERVISSSASLTSGSNDGTVAVGGHATNCGPQCAAWVGTMMRHPSASRPNARVQRDGGRR